MFEPTPHAAQAKGSPTRPDLVLQGRVIKVLPCVTFLGVKIDQELWWKEQGAKVIAKGQDWVAKMG